MSTKTTTSWLPPSDGPIDGSHLYSIGEEVLKRSVADICGLPLKRVSEIMQVAENHWDDQENGLFAARFSMGGRRSFVPSDLSEAEEASVLQLAETCGDRVAQAQIYEVLLARYPHGWQRYQPKVVDARLACLELFEDWPDLIDAVARATVLATQAKNETQLSAALIGWELVAAKVLASEFYWAFTRVALAFARLVLRSRWARPFVDPARFSRWNISVRWHARSRPREHFYLQMISEEAGEWCGLIGDDLAKVDFQRDQIQDLLLEAEERGGLAATNLLSRALKLANDRGGRFKDLALAAKRAFPAAMKQGEAEFKPYSMKMRVPQPIVDAINEMLERAPDVLTVLRSLAVFPLLMELSKGHIEASAKKSMERFIAWRMMPSASHRDGKIVSAGNSEGHHLREQTALVSRLHIGNNEVVLNHALAKIFHKLTPTDLWDAVAHLRGLNPRRAAFLQTASERFKAEDWISSGVLVATMYESVLRDFVRSLGYPALQIEPDGIHADQTLGDMLRAPEVREILGHQHADMVTHVLVDPEHGMNIRNDVGHGTAHPGALTPDRVFAVWLFMIRLTLIRPLEEEDVADEVISPTTTRAEGDNRPGPYDATVDHEDSPEEDVNE